MILVGPAAFCQFKTIQGAVDFLEQIAFGEQETIRILSGIYEEQVIIYRPNLNMMGIGAIEITMNRYATEMGEAGHEIGTFATPTLFLGVCSFFLSFSFSTIVRVTCLMVYIIYWEIRFVYFA